MSKFETVVELVNQYGEVVVELVPDGIYYKVPRGFVLDCLDVGDTYSVRERETEVD